MTTHHAATANSCTNPEQAGRLVPGIAPSFAEALVDPGGVFRNSLEVVEHPRFTREEKRTILLSWAQDELLLEQVANRTPPELRPKSRIDSVLEALSHFDASAAAEFCTAVASIRSGNLHWVSGKPAPLENTRREAPVRTA